MEHELRNLVALARAAENEACARIADEWCIGHNMAAPKIAAAIRARINEPDLVPPQSKP